jgi:hypothetical protein
MKNFLILLIIFLQVSILAIPAEAQSLTGQKAESIKNEVEALFKEMLINAENLDYSKLSMGVDDKHSAGFIVNGKYYSKYSPVIDDMKSGAQGISRQDISIKEKKTTVLSDQIVLMTVSGTSRATLNDNQEIVVNFHWSIVYEKIDKNWKVIHTHQSGA